MGRGALTEWHGFQLGGKGALRPSSAIQSRCLSSSMSMPSHCAVGNARATSRMRPRTRRCSAAKKKRWRRPSARPQARADGRAGGCAPRQTHGPRPRWAGSSRRSARQAGPQVNNVYTTCTRKSASKRRARRNEGGALGAPTCSSSTTLSSCGRLYTRRVDFMVDLRLQPECQLCTCDQDTSTSTSTRARVHAPMAMACHESNDAVASRKNKT